MTPCATAVVLLCLWLLVGNDARLQPAEIATHQSHHQQQQQQEKRSLQLESQMIWPKFMRNSQNTGWDGDIAVVDSPFVQWQYATRGQITASPVIDSNGDVYVGSYDKNMYSFTRAGQLRWKRLMSRTGLIEDSSYISSTAALDPLNNLYFGDWKGYFYAYSSLGDAIWTFDASAQATAPQSLGAIVSSPVLDTTVGRERVYYGSDNTFVYCLNSKDGTRQWVFQTAGKVQAPVALGLKGLSSGMVFVGSFDRKFYAIDVATGTQKWVYQGLAIFLAGASISFDGSTVYVGEADNAGSNMYALNAGTGTLLWKFPVINAIWSTPAVDQKSGEIFFPTQSSRFYGLTSAGVAKWIATLGEQGTTSPALTSDGVLYVGCSDSSLLAIDSADGSIMWTYDIPLATGVSASSVQSSVAMDSDGALYFGADNFNLYKIVNAPPTLVPTPSPTPVPTPTAMLPRPSPQPTLPPTMNPTARSTPPPTPLPTTAQPTAIPTFNKMQTLSETAQAMGCGPNKQLDTVEVTFAHLFGPNKFWFLTVYVYGTGVYEGQPNQGMVITTLNGNQINNPDPLNPTLKPGEFPQDPGCFCEAGIKCPNPLPAYRSSILNFNVTASMINAANGGSIKLRTRAEGFCRAACPYNDLYDLYIRYKLSGSLPGPTFQPTFAGTRPSPSPTAWPTTLPSPNPTPHPTTPFPTMSPTPVPTSPRPTPSPSLLPTFFKNTQGPTLITTTPRDMNALPLICPAFSVVNTLEARQNFAECQVFACPGQSFTVGDCVNNSPNAKGGQCQGDQFIRLFALDYPVGKQEVAFNDDFCGACSQITYTVPLNDKCMVYSIREGCFGQGACAGVMHVSGDIIGVNAVRLVPIVPSTPPTPAPTAPTPSPSMEPTAHPSVWPTYVANSPTPEPSVLPTNPTPLPTTPPTPAPSNPSPNPTSVPTMLPEVPTPNPTQMPNAPPTPFPSPPPTTAPTPVVSQTDYCTLYTATGPNPSAVCGMRACGNVRVSVSMCPSPQHPLAWCAGPTNLTLADSFGANVRSIVHTPVGTCGTCAAFSFTTPAAAPCQVYTIRESCMGNANTCMGVAAISSIAGTVQLVTFSPTQQPTGPSPNPSASPTMTPGNPTPDPTPPPSSTPTTLPTMFPSIAPTLTVHPTALPTPASLLVCPRFVATRTDTDNTNVQTCGLSMVGPVCGGVGMTISTCPTTQGAFCQGMVVLRLFDQNKVEQQMTPLPDECGGCPSFSFTTAWNAPCQVYAINQGCVMGQACAGVTAITNYVASLANPTTVVYSPTAAPTSLPTAMPDVPTFAPTPAPSVQPTLMPVPTFLPSPAPSSIPTAVPSSPTSEPSPAPTYLQNVPTPMPSNTPTSIPTLVPSAFPTTMPTSHAPSTIPTASPTSAPTQPTALPSHAPTYLPGLPTPKPTDVPISAPSPNPTSPPSVSPTLAPSLGPTIAPSRPTPVPTRAPSFLKGVPTPVPTTFTPSTMPTPVPSVAPSPLILLKSTSMCPLFTATGPANIPGKPTSALCGIYACPGTTFTVSMCPNVPGTVCAGSPALSLFASSNGTFVTPNSANPDASCGRCPQFSYTPSLPCQIYVMNPGCADALQCGGIAAVTAVAQTVLVLSNASLLTSFNPPTPRPTSQLPTRKPSQFPSYLPRSPTPRPTQAPTTPTFAPSPSPTFPFVCPPYSANGTNSALNGPNSAQCSFYACPSQVVQMGSCSRINGGDAMPSCRGDEFIRLFNAQGDQVAFNDDGGPGCGQCSNIVYTVPPNAPCQNYVIREGCYQNTHCSGTPLVVGAVGAMPPGPPTMLPSAHPSKEGDPTLMPTTSPSFLPLVPTPAPSPASTPRPSFFIFGAPSPAPSLAPLKCPWFMAVNTFSDQRRFMTCAIYACAGTTFTVSTCQGNVPGATCKGDTYLQLFGAPDPVSGDQQMLIDNDNGPGSCGLCSQFTFTATGPCQVYTINQGCMGMGGCSGDTMVAGNSNAMGIVTFRPTMRGSRPPTRVPSPEPSVSPTPVPTVWPTYLPKSPTPDPSSHPTSPSPRPTALPTSPSPLPSMMPTMAQICPPYLVSDTRFNTINYAVCSFVACPGAVITMTSCTSPTQPGPACVGDQMFNLFDNVGIQVPGASNDNACGLCSAITFTATVSQRDGTCPQYNLRQGCSGNSTCGGTTQIYGHGVFSLSTNIITPTPTLAATVTPLPTFAVNVPTPEPTATSTLMKQVTQLCPIYYAYGTNTDTINVAACGVYACPGTTFTLSMCPNTPGAYCRGDTYLRLTGADGTLLAENNNGPVESSCGSCSQISFSATAPCQVYNVLEGCGSNRACSGTVGVTSTSQSVVVINFPPSPSPTTTMPSAIPSPSPTALPDVPTSVPTPAPTSPTPHPSPGSPTRAPTSSPTLAKFCPPFSVTDTNNARDGRFATCLITACPGDLLSVGNCLGSMPGSSVPGEGCFGDQYIRLFDPSGKQVAFNDNFCGPCSALTYNVSSYSTDKSQCYTFVLREGCADAGSCGGVMSVSGGNVMGGIPSATPTIVPTLIPAIGAPTPNPSSSNMLPTMGPTTLPLTCTEYVTGETNDNTVNWSSCGIYACAGVTFGVSTCSDVPGTQCDGDTFLSLATANGTVVASNDDGANPACGLCSMFSYTTRGPCQVYTLREGCGGTDACRGAAAISGSALDLAGIEIVDFAPTLLPTVGPTSPTMLPSIAPSFPPSFGPSTAPSYLPYVPTLIPTPAPSAPTRSPTPQPSNPTFLPTIQPTYGQICPPYRAANTASTTQNMAICGLYACGGTTLTIGNCGDGCYGDQYLRLYDSVTSQQVAFDDDGCGGTSLCSRMVYTVPADTACRTYFIWEGCNKNEDCEGTVNFIGVGGSQAAILQTSVPTPFITPFPFISNAPTLIGGTVTPSVQPTQAFVNSEYCLLFQGQRAALGQTYPFCQVYACPGTTFTVSTCSQTAAGAFCFGDPYIKMYSAAGFLVAANDNGHGPCGSCSELTYTSQETTCQLFTIKEGCQGDAPCSGQVAVVAPFGAVSLVTQGPTPSPVWLPDQGPPSPLPTALPSPQPSALPTFTVTPGPTTDPGSPSMAPTLVPSPAPSANPTGPTEMPVVPFLLPDKCGPYFGSMTNSSTRAVTQCAIQVCPGTSIVIGGCDYSTDSFTSLAPGIGCRGDQFLRLFDNNDQQVATDDDYCGMCSQITLTIDGTPNSDNCVTYVLDQGCYGNSTCSGVTNVFGAVVVPLPGAPTFFPTSSVPTPVPTPIATSATPTTASPTNPTAVPSLNPTYLPNDPTPAPTVHPSAAPSAGPTPHPSASPTAMPTIPPTQLPSMPSGLPTLQPTYGHLDPTPSPTVMPTAIPSTHPIVAPSTFPTPLPSALPSIFPTPGPSSLPTEPSPMPSAEPTGPPRPTPLPGYPTFLPTVRPTRLPSPHPSELPSAVPSPHPSALPTSFTPTVVPTSEPTGLSMIPTPTPIPTLPTTALPTTYASVFCPSFETTATKNATQNNVACGLDMCAGVTVTIGNCPVPTNQGLDPSLTECQGDTILRLFDQNGLQVAFNDDGPAPGCGRCSQLTYTTPGSGGGCMTYSLNQGCQGNSPCSGRVQISDFVGVVTIVPLAPSLQPTPQPSLSPLQFPTPAPTALPSISTDPTTVPSLAPSTPIPTRLQRPTRAPVGGTFRPSQRGNKQPSFAPSQSWEGQDIYKEIGQLRANVGTGESLSAVNSSFGSVVTFTGLLMVVGAPTFSAGTGMVEIFDCSPLMARLDGGCTSVKVLQGSTSGLGFGSSIQAAFAGSPSAMIAIGVPNSPDSVIGRAVQIYNIASLDMSTTKASGVIRAKNNPNYANGIPQNSVFGSTLAIFQPSYTDPRFASALNDPVLLAVGDSAAQMGAGAVYVYVGATASLANWSLGQTFRPNTGDMGFGSVMAHSMQGLVAIGAQGNTGVVVYIYQMMDGTADFSPFELLGTPVLFPVPTMSQNVAYSLAITTDTLLLGLPAGNAEKPQGLAAVFELGVDDNTRMPTFKGPVATYGPDAEEYASKRDLVQFGSTVAMVTRVSGTTVGSEMAITCPGCGQADPRGSTYIYICPTPGQCGTGGSNNYIQRVYVDADQCRMSRLGPNAVAFSQTGSILAVGAPPSFGSAGSITYYNAAQFPFTSRPTATPTLCPSAAPSRPPPPPPTRGPTRVPTFRVTTVSPTVTGNMFMKMTLYMSLSAQGSTAPELKSAIDFNAQVQAALINSIISTCQGTQYLATQNFATPPFVTSLTQFKRRLEVADVADVTELEKEMSEGAVKREDQGEEDRKLQTVGTVFVMFQLTIPISGTRLKPQPLWLNSRDIAFSSLRSDFIDGFSTTVTPNQLSKTLQTNCAAGTGGGCSILATATVTPAPGDWIENNGPMADTTAPTPGPTPSPTSLLPTAMPSMSPSSRMPISALGSGGIGAVFSNPTTLGGVVAGGVVALIVLILACRYAMRSKDDQSENLVDSDENQEQHDQQQMYGGQPEYLQNDEEFVERPSGGVEMLQNPMGPTGDWGRRNTVPPEMLQSALDYRFSEDNDSIATHDQDLPEGSLPPPPRRENDPYNRMPGAGPQARPSVINPLQSVGLPSFIPPPPPGITGGDRFPVTAQQPNKRFSAQAQQGEFSRRLGSLAVPLSPGAPPLLRPFQKEQPISSPGFAAPRLAPVPLQHAPADTPIKLTLVPSNRLSTKLKGDRDA